MSRDPRKLRSVQYWLGASLLLALYALVAALLVLERDFTDQGPLSRHQPGLSAPLPGGVSLETVLEECFPERAGARTKVVGAEVDGRLYYAS